MRCLLCRQHSHLESICLLALTQWLGLAQEEAASHVAPLRPPAPQLSTASASSDHQFQGQRYLSLTPAASSAPSTGPGTQHRRERRDKEVAIFLLCNLLLSLWSETPEFLFFFLFQFRFQTCFHTLNRYLPKPNHVSSTLYRSPLLGNLLASER